MLVEFSPTGLLHFDEWKDGLLRKAEHFGECVPPDRSRAAVDRYRTARRFSVARARSADARGVASADEHAA